MSARVDELEAGATPPAEAEQLQARIDELEGRAAAAEQLQARIDELEAGAAAAAETMSTRFLQATVRVLNPARWPGNQKAEKFLYALFRELQDEVAIIAAEDAERRKAA